MNPFAADTSVKLHLPRPLPDALLRPALLATLDQALDYPLTAVLAPPGYGKTTLLAQWAQQTPARVIWLNCDLGDRPAVSLLTELLTALPLPQQLMGGLYAALQQSGQLPLDGLMPALTERMSRAETPLCLLLDDFHLLQDAAALHSLARLIESMPPRMHLLLGSRRPPQEVLRLPRVFAYQNFLLIDVEQLAFSAAELCHFLARAGLELDASKLNQIHAQTEGWPLSCQLFLKTLQRYPERLPALLEGAPVNGQDMLVYLLEDLLTGLSAEIVRFLGQTAWLGRFNADLAQAVTGLDGCAAHIAYLRRNHLFIVALDADQTWFRYHPMFAAALQQYWQSRHPEQPVLLAALAAAWCAEQQQPEAAFDYALASQNLDLLNDLLHPGLVFGHLQRQRVQRQLLQVLRQQPVSELLCRPKLSLAYIWSLYHACEIQRAEALLAQLDALNPAGHLAVPAADWRPLLAWMDTLRAHLALHLGALTQACDRSRDALTELGGEDVMVLSHAHYTLGLASLRLGRPAEGHAHRRQARDWALRGQMPRLLASLELLEAQIARHHGQLGVAAASLAALQHAGQERYPPLLQAKYLTELALIHWYQGRGSAAERDVEAAIAMLAQSRSYETFAVALELFELALDCERRDWSRALETSLESQLAQFRDWPIAEDFLALQSCARLLETELPARALAMPEPERGYGERLRVRFRLQWLLRQKQPGEALKLWARWEPVLRDLGASHESLKHWVLRALIARAQGDEDGVLAALKQALMLGQRGDYLQPFVQAAPAFAACWPRIATAVANGEIGLSEAYFKRLLTALPLAETAPNPSLTGLTEREQACAELLLQGLSYQQMSERLFVSVNTVKSHLKHLYKKLDVGSRREAIARLRTGP